ncbi:MAG: matrixin family metalloprotease [SAR324 cluster bacterium]|nr:matrixin family metalloprotease [SAR324 cluster bacterium]
MCPLTRRNLLIGGSGLLLFGCSDSESYTAAKDYYPVTSRYIFHWGKNSSIVIDKDATNATYSLGGSVNELSWFETGVTAWASTLNEIGISVSFSASSPDVKVYWLNSTQMLAKAGSPHVLGQATTDKEIYMLKGQDQATTTAVATHEFGHMLGIWSHSFDSNDLMYPYLSTSLSTRDKRTLVDFLYELSPDFDLHDVAGPLVHSSTGVSIPHYVSSLTTNGCQIRTSIG